MSHQYILNWSRLGHWALMGHLEQLWGWKGAGAIPRGPGSKCGGNESELEDDGLSDHRLSISKSNMVFKKNYFLLSVWGGLLNEHHFLWKFISVFSSGICKYYKHLPRFSVFVFNHPLIFTLLPIHWYSGKWQEALKRKVSRKGCLLILTLKYNSLPQGQQWNHYTEKGFYVPSSS